jgi:hypothetical protein
MRIDPRRPRAPRSFDARPPSPTTSTYDTVSQVYIPILSTGKLHFTRHVVDYNIVRDITCLRARPDWSDYALPRYPLSNFTFTYAPPARLSLPLSAPPATS